MGCSVNQKEHLQVARSFAEQLNLYLNEPSEENKKKLADYCSSYTYSLAQNPLWAKRIVPEGTLLYAFVSDSLSHDKMRAYVWFTNQNQAPEAPIYCLELRQSLDGWVVDMPLF